MRLAVRVVAVLLLGGAIGGCAVVDAASTVTGVAVTAVGVAADVGSSAVSTAAHTVVGSSSDDDKSN